MIVNELQYSELHEFLKPVLRLESHDIVGRKWHAILKMPLSPVGSSRGVPEHERLLLRYKGYDLDILHARWFDRKGSALHLHFKTRKKWWHGLFKDQNAELIRDLRRICTNEVTNLAIERYDYTSSADGWGHSAPQVKCSLFHDGRAFNKEWRDNYDISPLCIGADAHDGKCFVQLVFLAGGYDRSSGGTSLRPNWRDFSKEVAEDIELVASDILRIDELIDRGNAYRQAGELDKAIADYTEAIRLSPTAAGAYNNNGIAKAYASRGLAHCDKGEYDKAIADHTESIRLRPDFDATYCLRGVAHSKAGDRASAELDFDEAERLGFVFQPPRSVGITPRPSGSDQGQENT